MFHISFAFAPRKHSQYLLPIVSYFILTMDIFHTCCYQMLYSSFSPLDQIASFTTTHIKHILTRSYVSMDQDAFHPIIKASKSNDARLFTFHYTYIWSIVVMLCYRWRISIVLMARRFVASVFISVVVASFHSVKERERKKGKPLIIFETVGRHQKGAWKYSFIALLAQKWMASIATWQWTHVSLMLPLSKNTWARVSRVLLYRFSRYNIF